MLYDELEYRFDDTELLGDVILRKYPDERRFLTNQKPFCIDLTMPLPLAREILQALGCANIVSTANELATAGTIFANLYLHVGEVFYSRDRNHYAGLRRYRQSHISYRNVTSTVDALARSKVLNHVLQRPSSRNRLRSHFSGSNQLAEVLHNLVDAAELTRATREPIVLRDEDKRPKGYSESQSTRAARSEILAFNDFLSTFRVSVDLRILCGLLGIDRPFGDQMYDPFQVAGLDRRRIKKAFNILLNTTSKKGAKCALAGAFSEEENVGYPDGRHFREAAVHLQAVEDLFPFLVKFWGKVFGLRLLNVDAAICARIISSLIAQGVPCLSVHDSFIVPSRHEDLLRGTMEENFQTVMRRLRKVGERGIALGVL